ncbi:hypothetical protein NPIL_235651 [Nephila pilipes]|uniref:Uncharacterized protein n=1 Tax=Nephila pilipes TaxID=299642 RepID=A0A8X6J0G4_NEPPI|nr:hypothetical protein NPIL_235651 [Nephila pilipes]
MLFSVAHSWSFNKFPPSLSKGNGWSVFYRLPHSVPKIPLTTLRCIPRMSSLCDVIHVLTSPSPRLIMSNDKRRADVVISRYVTCRDGWGVLSNVWNHSKKGSEINMPSLFDINFGRRVLRSLALHWGSVSESYTEGNGMVFEICKRRCLSFPDADS